MLDLENYEKCMFACLYIQFMGSKFLWNSRGADKTSSVSKLSPQ